MFKRKRIYKKNVNTLASRSRPKRVKERKKENIFHVTIASTIILLIFNGAKSIEYKPMKPLDNMYI